MRAVVVGHLLQLLALCGAQGSLGIRLAAQYKPGIRRLGWRRYDGLPDQKQLACRAQPLVLGGAEAFARWSHESGGRGDGVLQALP